ncbi:hypothetical protein [Pseudomonas sp. NFX183]|uniref:hypothetical protein n=1 Tax=Pseudomonas sp. NFX183 TaxID=3399573 RepID=UPI003A5BFD61
MSRGVEGAGGESGLSAIAPVSAIALKPQSREAQALRFARCCYNHLAGPLGVQLLSAMCEAGWLRRSKDSRAVRVTPKGWTQLKAQLGLDPA